MAVAWVVAGTVAAVALRPDKMSDDATVGAPLLTTDSGITDEAAVEAAVEVVPILTVLSSSVGAVVAGACDINVASVDR